MFITYKPELSFHGTLHWEMRGGHPVHPQCHRRCHIACVVMPAAR